MAEQSDRRTGTCDPASITEQNVNTSRAEFGII
jgi:hypothetical protein